MRLIYPEHTNTRLVWKLSPTLHVFSLSTHRPLSPLPLALSHLRQVPPSIASTAAPRRYSRCRSSPSHSTLILRFASRCLPLVLSLSLSLKILANTSLSKLRRHFHDVGATALASPQRRQLQVSPWR